MMSMPSDEKTVELCRIVAALNYDGQQTLVTPQSFVKPNFTLVYDLLKWFARILVGRPDDLSLSAYSIEDHDRKLVTDMAESTTVDSLINLGRLFHSKLGVHLNLVQLYRADASCCVELWKVAKPIHEAVESFVNDKFKYADSSSMTKMLESVRAEMDATLVVLRDEISKSPGKRDLAASISGLAEKLEILLDNEPNFNEQRQRVIDRRVELANIEQVLQTNHGCIIERTKELAKSNEELCKDLVRLDERLRAKEMEVDSSIERLNDLLVESPQYLSQYEQLYKDYETSYEAYVSKYRNLNYLESCVYSSDRSNDILSDASQLDEDAANPLGSTTDGSFSAGRPPADAAGGGFRNDELELSDTTGPARLAESLPDELGDSKPISASLGVDAAGAAAGAEVGRTGTTGAGLAATTGRREMTVEMTGRRTNVGRPTVAGDSGLEGLLREFVADSELETGCGLYGTEPDEEDGSTDEDAMGTP